MIEICFRLNEEIYADVIAEIRSMSSSMNMSMPRQIGRKRARKMNENLRGRLKPILVTRIQEALDDREIQGLEFPWFGDNVSNIMADAALAVLEGMSDQENWLIKNGYLENY